jgi:glyoxylase-like metal-dependent hydrolase (beta-lactamase superfamily II)
VIQGVDQSDSPWGVGMIVRRARREFAGATGVFTGATAARSQQALAMCALEYRVFTIQRPGLTPGLPPGHEALSWVANSATLIFGEREAVLVDTFLTIDQNVELADAVAATGKHLTAIYITHGHGDHCFGINTLRLRFPGVRAVATAAVVDRIAGQLAPEMLEGFWRQRFGAQIPEDPGTAEPLDEEALELEGHSLVPIKTGHTDTADSTSLHVPSLGLITAGDVVYNGIHPYLAESTAQTRLEWIDALDKLDSLKPRAVVAGHKVPDHDDSPRNIAETRQYLRDFIRLAQATDTARELFDVMLERYPDRANPGSLWGAANAAKAESPSPVTTAPRRRS